MSEYNIPRGLLERAAGRIEELEQRMAEQQPSVGRAVHYVAYGTPGGEFPAGVCRAATITEVTYGKPDDDPRDMPADAVETVGLCVMNPTGLFFNRGIPYDPNKAPGTWHWPEFVAAK